MWHTRNHEESNSCRHFGPRGGHRGVFGKFGAFGGRGFGGRGGFGQDGPGGMGRRRGLYDSEELRLVLLSLISEKSRHGYDLIKEIEEQTGGAYAPSPGIIYPTLTMLVDMGLITEGDADGTRKVYAVTAEGTAHLAQNRDKTGALLARIKELGSSSRSDTAPVHRAVHNLRAALQEKLSKSGDKDLAHRIAALLDEVTQKIERS